jgi:hypothetical protein
MEDEKVTNRNEAYPENNRNRFHGEDHGRLSSLELLWVHVHQELDSWAEQFEYYDQVFLNAVKKYVERVKQDRENMKAITDQFHKEFQEWETAAREDLLMRTTTIQQIFPKKSYHEINQVIDDIQNKMAAIFLTPINAMTNNKALDQYVKAIEQSIFVRKQTRQRLIENVKQSANIIYGIQKQLINILEGQLKAAFFPLQKYMENSR